MDGQKKKIIETAQKKFKLGFIDWNEYERITTKEAIEQEIKKRPMMRAEALGHPNRIARQVAYQKQKEDLMKELQILRPKSKSKVNSKIKRSYAL